MSATLAVLGPFGDAFAFIFKERDSVGGGVKVGGLGEIGDLAATHMLLSIVSIAAAVAVAVPLGLYLGHQGKGQFLAVSLSNVGRAVPVLAVLAFFIAFLGIGFTNVAVALFLLAVPPILTNTYVGTRGVDNDIVDASRGMGMTGMQIVRSVRLPLALPPIFAGIRVSAVSVIASATIATYSNVQTLGEPIFNQQTYGFSGALGAAIVVAIITLAADAGIGAAQRAVTPKGIKLAEGGRQRSRFLPSIRRREATT